MVSADQLTRLPIFPLPNAVLIPGGQIPLRVFEPRYRSLVADCLKQNHPFGLALLAPNPDEQEKPPVHPALGLGQIIASQTTEEGYLIVVEGLARVRMIRELPTNTLYRVVETELLCDLPQFPDGDDLTLGFQTLRTLGRRLAKRLPGPAAGPLLNACGEERDGARLADVIAAALLTHPADRQKYLSERDVNERVDRVTRRLAEVIAYLDVADGSGAN